MYCTYPLLVRVRVDTDTRFSHTIKSRNLYTDEGQMERKGQFSLIGKTAFGWYKTSILVINWAFRRDKTRRFNTRGVVLISFRFLSFAIRQQNRRS